MKIFKFIAHFPIRKSGNWNNDHFYKAPRESLDDAYLPSGILESKNVEYWSGSVAIHLLRKMSVFGFKLCNNKSRRWYLREPLWRWKVILYWNYKDGNGTETKRRFLYKTQWDLYWILKLWMEEEYSPIFCWNNEVVFRGKLIILILLLSTEYQQQ